MSPRWVVSPAPASADTGVELYNATSMSARYATAWCSGSFNIYEGHDPLNPLWCSAMTGNAAGDGIVDITVTFKKRYPVNGLYSSSIGSNSITINWSAVPNALNYRVYRNGSHLSTTSATSYTFTGLSANTSYTLGVRWVSDTGNVSDLAQITRTTGTSSPSLPPAVSGCTYSISGTYLYAGHYSGVTAETSANSAAAREAQCLLKAWGSYNPGPVDGQWGPQSRSAAEAFQNHMRNVHSAPIAADGYVGPQTWPYLRSHQKTAH